MWNQTEELVNALEVKKMREGLEDFGKMAQEVLNVFKSINSLEIKKIHVPEESNNSLMIFSLNSSYIEVSIHSQTPFEKSEAITDLLQSALKESKIISSNGINSTLKNFLTQATIKSVHPMIGSTTKSLLHDFDNFIESTKNHELTFAQKLKKFK